MSTNAVGENSGPASKKGWRRFWMIAGCVFLAVWLLPFVILPSLGICRIYTIPTSGMDPTFSAGDHILVNEMAFRSGDPRRGDLVVFSLDGITNLPANTSHQVWIKRVAGLPGEKITIRSGKLLVNGLEAAELSSVHYVTMPGSPYLSRDGDELLIPQGAYFVLGDNSPNSADSRLIGCIPKANFRGRVVSRLWHNGGSGTSR